MSLYDLDKGPFVLVIILVFFAFTIICLGEVWDQDVYSRNEWNNCRENESMSNFLDIPESICSLVTMLNTYRYIKIIMT